MSHASSAPTYRSGETRVSPEGVTAAAAEARGSALNFLTALAAEISSGVVNLPCFPNIVINIRRALSDPKVTPEQTVKMVGAEPRLAARLLQTANSAAFNLSGKPVADLRGAITRLGYAMVQSAALSFAVQHMKEEQSLKPIAADLTALWKESICVASICQVLARRTKVAPDTAFLTGLVHGIGRLYIMARGVAAPAVAADQGFADMVASWHASIGKAILENWNFPEEMCEAVGSQEEFERKHRGEPDLSDILVIALLLARNVDPTHEATRQTANISAFQVLPMTAKEYAVVIMHARYQLDTLVGVLGA